MFEFVAAARWSDAAEDVNAMSDEGAAGVARAYSPAKLVRLRALKTAYDPDPDRRAEAGALDKIGTAAVQISTVCVLPPVRRR